MESGSSPEVIIDELYKHFVEELLDTYYDAVIIKGYTEKSVGESVLPQVLPEEPFFDEEEELFIIAFQVCVLPEDGEGMLFDLVERTMGVMVAKVDRSRFDIKEIDVGDVERVVFDEKSGKKALAVTMDVCVVRK